jgi:hypothetical protein
VFNPILTLDAIAMDALLLEILQDRVNYRLLLKRREHEAQSLLNLLQAVNLIFFYVYLLNTDAEQRLGLPLDPSLNRHYIRAVIKLAHASGLYPECMTLKGIEIVGKVAVDGGGFGDIWMGSLRGQAIAVMVFSSEAVTWRQLKHQNVLPFYGVFRLEDDRLCFASPWMHNGNLVHFLASFPDTKCVPLVRSPKTCRWRD